VWGEKRKLERSGGEGVVLEANKVEVRQVRNGEGKEGRSNRKK